MKKSMIFFLPIIIFISMGTQCVEFLYPVGHKKDSEEIYLMYQKSSNHVELWLWNPTTKVAHKGLLSRFTPGGLKMLPNQKGFSFIDNGRVRIKFFDSKSPKSIEIYAPIYNIQALEWLTDSTCYLSAKENDVYGIYQLTIDGVLKRLITHKYNHNTYPQIIDNTLFYIEQVPIKGHYHYQLAQISFDYNGNTDNKKILLNCGIKSIAFLKMISTNEGFAVQHPWIIGKKERIMKLKYLHIKNIEGTWSKEKLFSFSIPTNLLFSNNYDSQLYESIMPLLPWYNDGIIYYSDCGDSHLCMNLFAFDLITRQADKLTNAIYADEYYFKPFNIEKRIVFGGSIVDEHFQLNMWINNDHAVCFSLPYLKK